jgi:D-aminopeptidase
LNDQFLDPIFAASVECVEEAVVNALPAAEDTPTFRPPGGIVPALRADRLLELMRGHGRMA